MGKHTVTEALYVLGAARLDIGLGNPNKTAAVFAALMLAVWVWPLFRGGRFWPLVGLAAWSAASWPLAQTESRGAYVALAAGWLILLPVFWRRGWGGRGVFLAASLICAACFLRTGASERFAGVAAGEGSVTNRLMLWREAPRMIADAPGGWGVGNAGRAFMEWYQPLGHTEKYRTLVNSHLTWLVEFGWAGRLAYLAFWAAVAALCWSGGGRPWDAVFAGSLAVWAVFGVAATFSSVAESPWTWVVPGVMLAVVLVVRWRRRVWPGKRVWGLAVTTVAGVLFLLSGAGGGLKKEERGVVVGRGPVQAVALVKDRRVFGELPGRVWRGYADRLAGVAGSVLITDDAEVFVETRAKRYVTGGSTAAEVAVGRLPPDGAVALLNPECDPALWAARENLEVVTGEFSTSPWKIYWDARPGARMVEGAGDFLENWPGVAEERRGGERER